MLPHFKCQESRITLVGAKILQRLGGGANIRAANEGATTPVENQFRVARDRFDGFRRQINALRLVGGSGEVGIGDVGVLERRGGTHREDVPAWIAGLQFHTELGWTKNFHPRSGRQNVQGR